MVVCSTRLLLLSAISSFCANWQFAFQISYVNTAARSFHSLASRAYRVSQDCQDCHLPPSEWASQWSLIVSAFYPGSVIGFLLMPVLLPRLGTKMSMGVVSVPAVVGCALQLVALLPSADSRLLDIALCGGRLLVGVQAGAALCFLPLYILEISPPATRSLINTFQQVSQALGTLLGLVVGCEFLLPHGDLRYFWLQVALSLFSTFRLFVFQAVAVFPTIALIFLLACTPPTPHYLLLNTTDITKVLSSLHYYQGGAADLESLQHEVASHSMKTAPRGRISTSSWKGFAVGSMAAASYAFTGDDLIDTFSTHILQTAQGGSPTERGYDSVLDHSADIMSIGLGVVLVLGSVLGSFLIDRFGRRRLLLLGLLATSVSNGLASLLLSSSHTLVLLFFSITKLSIGMGAGAPAWFLTSELVSLPFVPLFQSLSTGILLCSCMLVTFFFLPLSLLSPALSILILSTIPSIILAIFLFLLLPETKDTSSRQIQLILRSRIFSGLSTPSYDPLDSPSWLTNNNNNYGSF